MGTSEGSIALQTAAARKNTLNGALEGKLALISEATSGVGVAAARRLVAAGARVLGIGKSRESLAQTSAELGSCFHGEPADLGDPHSRGALCERLTQLEQPPDLFLSCASEPLVSNRAGLEPEELCALFQINVLAALDLCRAVVPLMQPGSRFVHLSTHSPSQISTNDFGLHTATTAAIDHFTDALRIELHARGIHVSMVAPDFTAEKRTPRASLFTLEPEHAAGAHSDWFDTDHIADVIFWLCSREMRISLSELVLVPPRRVR